MRRRWSSPGPRGGRWTKTTYDNWRKRAFDRACAATKVEGATPYALRHSFASLLLHEGRSVVYVARQLGHDARLSLTTYGHVIDELDDAARVAAEDAIRAARKTWCARRHREWLVAPNSTKAAFRAAARSAG